MAPGINATGASSQSGVDLQFGPIRPAVAVVVGAELSISCADVGRKSGKVSEYAEGDYLLPSVYLEERLIPIKCWKSKRYSLCANLTLTSSVANAGRRS
jgi:hypothetical protein